ncbi:MAG: hypothetical protein AB1665_02560 [Candidatus Thermoplasmatota archaeon]
MPLYAAYRMKGRGMSLVELSRQTGIPYQRLSELALELEKDGIVTKDFSSGDSIYTVVPEVAKRIFSGSTNVESIGIIEPLESDILRIGERQLVEGPHQGKFTPGYVRRETGKGYNVINEALGYLTDYGLLERDKHLTHKSGEAREIAIYKLTGPGLGVLENVEAGKVRIERRPQPAAGREGVGARPASRLDAQLSSIAEQLSQLDAKLDHVLARLSGARPSPPAKRVRGSLRNEALLHRLLLLDTVRHLSKGSRNVIASDVEEMYGQICAARDATPRSDSQVRNVLRRLEKEGYLTTKRVGCRSLGMRGHGSRLLVELTQTGSEYLMKNEKLLTR